jgi:hypothetical protein
MTSWSGAASLMSYASLSAFSSSGRVLTRVEIFPQKQGWSLTRAIARVSGTPSISRLVIVAARAPRVPFGRSLSAMANTTPWAT